MNALIPMQTARIIMQITAVEIEFEPPSLV